MYRALHLETTLDHYHSCLRKESQFLLYPFEQRGNQVCRDEELCLRSLGVFGAPYTARHCQCPTSWRQKQRTSGTRELVAFPTLLSLLILGQDPSLPGFSSPLPSWKRKMKCRYFSSFSRGAGDRLCQEWYSYSTDEPGGCYAKRNKPDTKRQIWHKCISRSPAVNLTKAERKIVVVRR